jgi:hypothetical protein
VHAHEVAVASQSYVAFKGVGPLDEGLLVGRKSVFRCGTGRAAVGYDVNRHATIVTGSERALRIVTTS